jgi:hypothetical protein
LGVGDGEALYELLYKLPPGEHRLKNKRARLMSAAVMPIVDAVGTPDDLSNDRQVSRMIARTGRYDSQTVFVKAEKLQKQVNAFAAAAKKRKLNHEAKSRDKKHCIEPRYAGQVTFIDDSMSADCKTAGLEFHFAVKGSANNAENAGGYWQAPTMRKQELLKELAMKAWGGQVWEMLKAEAVTEILACNQPIKELKILH